MKTRLLLFGLFLTSIAGYSQDPTIDAGVDTVLCSPDCVVLEATFLGGGNTTDYSVASIPYAAEPYGGTVRVLSDDATTGAIGIGFDFCFYGNTYSNFYISSNGWLGFSGGPGTWSPSAIPSALGSVPKNCVMGPWQDLNPSITGTIQYEVLGVSPFRRLVVSWEAVAFFSCTGTLNTQQIILFETTNVIENHIETKLTCPGWAGGRAVQGVHNIDGSEAVTFPGRNNTVWAASDHAIRYTPLGDPEVEWYVGPLLIGTGPTITVCPGSPTTYIAKLISCSGIVAEDEVLVDQICCEPPIMSAVDVLCFGGCDGTATAEAVGVAPFTYDWDDPLSQTTATAVGLCAGIYEVTVTDALGCVETGEVEVLEPEELTGMVIVVNLVSCFGLTDGSGTVEGTGGTGVLTYDIGDGPMLTGEFTDLAPGTYTVTITDENGCFIEIPLDIVSPDLLEPVLVGTIDVSCNGGADGELTVDGIGGVTPYEFALDGGGYVLDGTFTGLTAGTYDVDIQDDNGCLTTIAVVITEPLALTLDLVGVVDVTCFGGSDGSLEVIGADGTGALEYSIDGGAYGAVPIFGGLSAGTYTLTVKDANDCETTLDVIINEPIPVAVDEIVVGEACLGDCLGSIDLDAYDGVAPYTFSIDDCATSDGVGSYTGLCAGTYDICVIDANGCEYTNTVTVLDGTAPADASITPIGPFCIDDAAVVLTAADPGGDFTGPGVVGGTFDPGLAGVGVHTITNTISLGCGDIATYNVTVNALPVVSFMTAVNSGCEDLTVPFINTGDVGSDCYWDFGDGTNSTFCGSVNHTYENAGDYDVSYTLIDANGCTSTSTFYDYISVYPEPNAVFRFGPQPATTINTEIQFTDMSTGADSWTWTFDALGNSNDQDPKFFFPEVPGNYVVNLVVENSYGCVDSTSQTVIISEQLLIFVPNAITPDGDLYNEVFKPYFNGIDIYDYTLTVYNRWGEVMFVSHDVTVGWNGTYGGELVPSGVYVWHINTQEVTSDKKLEFHGHVSVLK
ncbi:MAG: gliding motility-associated-like protein [Crocinitomix sp.]|jgi:gliding motility-associated-like protein